MSWIAPTVSQFKDHFRRDFPYAPDTDPDNLEFVTDYDVENAINEAAGDFNSDLFGASDRATQIFFYLAAHTLVMNLRNSSMGLSSQAKFMLSSSSVGGVSVSNQIPDRFANDPAFSNYLTTGYGKKYLEMVYAYTIGVVGISCGRTTAA